MAIIKKETNGVVYHASEAFAAAGGVVHGFASRLGGVSTGDFAQLNLGIKRDDSRENVRENYARFCAAIGADRDSLVMTHQVHSDDVRTASRADVLADLLDPIPYETDGLVTDQPGLCLVIYYADCIPVLLYDPVKKAIGAVHSGWRGTAMGIVPKAIEKMTALYGTDPADLLAAIGPGIGPCCFETHDDVPQAMAARRPASTMRTVGSPSMSWKRVHPTSCSAREAATFSWRPRPKRVWSVISRADRYPFFSQIAPTSLRLPKPFS